MGGAGSKVESLISRRVVVTIDDAVDEENPPGAVAGPSLRATSVPGWLDWGVSVWGVVSGKKKDRMNKMSPMRNIAPLMIRQVAAAARRTASVGGVVAPAHRSEERRVGKGGTS